jgi:hypothetical protein
MAHGTAIPIRWEISKELAILESSLGRAMAHHSDSSTIAFSTAPILKSQPFKHQVEIHRKT